MTPEYFALCGEKIDQVPKEGGALLPRETVLKHLGRLLNARWQAWRKTLVCSSVMGERELGSDRCKKNSQFRDGCGANFTKSERKLRCLRPGLVFSTCVWAARAKARKKCIFTVVVTRICCSESTLPCTVSKSTKSEKRKVRCCQAKRCSNGSAVL